MFYKLLIIIFLQIFLYNFIDGESNETNQINEIRK